jgi:hypothetical protein
MLVRYPAMTTPAFNIIGIDHLRWEFVAFGEDVRDVVLRFASSKGRTFPRALDIAGLQMSDWHFAEGIYNQCDEVRVFDKNQDCAQLELGRFVVQFVCNGEVIGQHIADSVENRLAG